MYFYMISAFKLDELRSLCLKSLVVSHVVTANLGNLN
jgi:hypothetical protein